jgi:hypothetical protein
MADDHWVEPMGTAKTKYGNSARVWVIGSKGREALSAGMAEATPLTAIEAAGS